MYDVTGRSAPYAEEARGEKVADLLVEQGGETEGAAGRALGEAELSALQGSELLPRAGKLLQVLRFVSEATPETALVLVGSVLIYGTGRYVTMEMTTNSTVDPSTADGFQYTGLTWAPEGTSIYFGATSPGLYLFTAVDWEAGVRWFEEPCTFSDFTPPAGAHMMTGVSSEQPGTQPQCRYPLPPPWYYGMADVFVDYPTSPKRI